MRSCIPVKTTPYVRIIKLLSSIAAPSPDRTEWQKQTNATVMNMTTHHIPAMIVDMCGKEHTLFIHSTIWYPTESALIAVTIPIMIDQRRAFP